MICSDLELSRRMERAEGYSCVQYARARRRLFPESRVAWMECAGVYVAFSGVDSPMTQTFCLGLFEDLTPASLDTIEQFFEERGSPVVHEVSPFAGVNTLELLSARHYRPIELTSVMYRPVEKTEARNPDGITVRVAGAEESQVWADTPSMGWAQEHPEYLDFLKEAGAISAACESSVCFLADLEGKPGAAGTLCVHEGVGLFGGAATIPAMRRRGLQTALIHARQLYAFENQLDLTMMCASPGSDSQRNAERGGFRIAYTRTKWRKG